MAGKSCQTAADCDDKNACTAEQCASGACVVLNQPAGAACDDADACTTEDRCNGAGKCAGTPRKSDDNDPCTKDACDPVTGADVHTPNPGPACDDGDLCTLGDQCDDSGKCVGVPKSIDDGNDCSEDSCDPATGNVSHKGQSGCKVCTTSEDCNDSNSCTVDTCIDSKCSFAYVGAGVACDDLNACTDEDTCNGAGKCIGTPRNPDDDDPCTLDECDPANGAFVHAPSSGASCDDGDLCTLGDQCDAGACKGVVKSVDDGDPCTQDTCDAGSGEVIHAAISGCATCKASSDCDDGNDCTTDVCEGGKCAYALAPVAAKCSDGSACTTGDACNGEGQCVGVPKPVDDGNPCTKDGCNPTTGEVFHSAVKIGTACSDGNACTTGDKCDFLGTCAGTPKPVDDGNPCTIDVCNSLTGIVSHLPTKGCKSCLLSSDCDDAQGCTKDSCVGGVCSYSSLINDTPCDDGNNCTTSDKCSAGVCKGTPFSPCTQQ